MKHLRWSFLLALALLLVAYGVASAAWTWTDPVTGPTYDAGTGVYTWDIDVTLLSNPQKVICLTYSTDNGVVPETSILCSGPGVGVAGLWTCELAASAVATGAPTNVLWDIEAGTAGSGGPCGDTTTGEGPSGTFPVGPTAVALSSFQAGTSRLVPLAAGVGLVAFLGGGTLILRRRRR